MTKVLVITGILPVAAIEHKRTENDILLVTEDEINVRYSNFIFRYIFVFPFANRMLAKVSVKWKDYFELKNKATYPLRGRDLFLLPMFLLPKRVFFRNLLAKISLYFNRKKIEKVIKEFKPTVIHAQSADIDAFVAKYISKKYNIPYIVTMRGLHLGADSILKRNLSSASALVAVSPKQLEAGKSLTNKEIIFIPHGVKKSFFSNTEERKVNNPIRLITVSRLLKMKNIDLVIESLAESKGNFIFDIYGEGPEKENLDAIIEKFDLKAKVRLQGFINNEDLPAKFCKYDVFVMPSYPEGLGRVYFEAMASGLPVIASKKTGIDGVIKDGIEGFLINHNSKQNMTSVLSSIANNPKLLIECGRNARRLADDYNWDKISEKYHNLYGDFR